MLQENEYEILIQRALLEIRGGNIQQGLLDLQTARDAGCDLASMHIVFGAAYEHLQEIDKAYAAYNSAIRADRNADSAYNNRGRIACQMGRLDEAIADFQKAIEICPENGRAYYNLGGLFEDQEQLTEALQAYYKAVEMDYEPATQAIKDVQEKLNHSSRSARRTQPESNQSNDDIRLIRAMVELAKFAYTMMGPHQRLEVVEIESLLLGVKRKLEQHPIWSTTIEPITQVSPSGRWDRILGATLDFIQAPQFLLRVTILNSEEYEVSIWPELKDDKLQKQFFGKDKESCWAVADSELENTLYGLVEKNVLQLQNGVLTFPKKIFP